MESSSSANVPKRRSSVQSVERAFLILDLLRDNRGSMGVSEIAHALDLSTTTTHRLLQALLIRKAVQQNPASRRYSLAPQMLLYGKAVLDQWDFIRSAHPMLGELSKSVRETVFMGVLDDFELVYVDHVDTHDHVLRMTPQLGRRQPCHCTALGKVLLAHVTSVELDEFFTQRKLEPITENTITRPEVLREELHRIGQQGYAVDREEVEIGICCVAAPIWGMRGHVLAAISVSGPSTRLMKNGLDSFLKDKVVETATEISSQITTLRTPVPNRRLPMQPPEGRT